MLGAVVFCYFIAQTENDRGILANILMVGIRNEICQKVDFPFVIILRRRGTYRISILQLSTQCSFRDTRLKARFCEGFVSTATEVDSQFLENLGLTIVFRGNRSDGFNFAVAGECIFRYGDQPGLRTLFEVFPAENSSAFT